MDIHGVVQRMRRQVLLQLQWPARIIPQSSDGQSVARVGVARIDARGSVGDDADEQRRQHDDARDRSEPVSAGAGSGLVGARLLRGVRRGQGQVRGAVVAHGRLGESQQQLRKLPIARQSASHYLIYLVNH